ncbi:hypothetical protein SanaruYs_29380 [Chryseotalea sanaruensis]|uniref:4'-phosphopantetheinyl transferase domain-containing protein n=1 Tax=Chryseotalea sanaruensis TaxID=2482724 RepID=A0A401UCU9_9BACT|nr:4'-phosphopantetheinyl transferase superfamily protein [Chryseotalea sanaruensis]GCC52700.1 hypothetical protein SanaruYs_29380 [Chryseotalea sanaruensis]
MQVIIASLTDFTEHSLLSVQARRKTKVLTSRHRHIFWKDKLRTEVGILLTEIMLLNMGIHENELNTLTRNTYGKPFLPGATIDFNISHSGDLVAAVCSPFKHVGIDLEQNRTIDISAYESIFHPNEWFLLNSTNSERIFFEIWTKKESLLKAKGLGFQTDLMKINVFDEAETQYHFHSIPIPDYTCHICSTFPLQEVELSYFSTEHELLYETV